MPPYQAQRNQFETRLVEIAKRINMSNLTRLIAFAESLELQQQGKRMARAQSMANRTKQED